MIPLEASRTSERRILAVHLRWLTWLRWLVGLAAVLGGLINGLWLHEYPGEGLLLAAGLAILAYNLPLWLAGRHGPRRWAVGLAWAHIVLDLLFLTLLVMWTGGARSPLLGFYVLHMVFASLLFSRAMAFACALLAVSMLLAGLMLTGQWQPDPVLRPLLQLAGFGLTLLLTVYLANRITLGMRRQHARLQARNRQIRRLHAALSRQQQSMIQHEKMVAMGQMAAGIAHEIANPLAAIDAVLQLTQRNPQRLTEERLHSLQQQTERIRNAVRQMTEFAHPTEFDWEVRPLSELAESSLAVIAFDRRLKGVQIERRYQDGLVRVQPHATQQALVNILINALDAMAGQPQPRLVVSTFQRNDEGWIRVQDNGPGILPEHRPRLFEPFFTTKPVGKGTGLGMAISYKLIHNQGGRIDVESTPGQGAAVSIVLPLAAEDVDKVTG